MKIKYIFSIAAGLIVLATTSCSEKKTTETDAEKAPSEENAEVVAPAPAKATTPATAETPAAAVTPETPAVAAPSAYYVMFTGKGWGIGNRARAALKTVDGVKSVVLSGLRATVKMNDGAMLDEKTVTDVLVKKGLSYVSTSTVASDLPVVVYVLSVGGVGWSDTEEKARVALGKVDKVTNVYVGKKTEIWMSEDATLDKDAITAMLDGFGFSLGTMEKTDKSTL
jgi:hypothetical protein